MRLAQHLDQASTFRALQKQELAGLLLASGFSCFLPSIEGLKDLDAEFNLSCWKCVRDDYADFLSVNCLLPRDNAVIEPKHLMLTTEYSDFRRTGGIGTFVRDWRDSVGFANTLCLFLGAGMDDLPKLSEINLVSPYNFFDDEYVASLPIEDQALQSLYQLLLYFPCLRSVQYADYQGLGCRIAQAKRSGLLPDYLTVVAHCHGNTHYIENANEKWFASNHFGVAEKEKISLENADKVIFPAKFLFDLYEKSGIRLSPENVLIQRYPFNLSVGHASTVEIIQPKKIDTIIFYGKFLPMKGYPLFLDSVMSTDPEKLKQAGVEKIVFIGSDPFGEHTVDSRMQSIQQAICVETHANFGRDDVVNYMVAHREHSVCVMPYLGDNHPYAVSDVLYSGMLPLMANAGGIPEMIPHEFHERLLPKPDPTDLSERLLALLQLSANEQYELRLNLFKQTVAIQERLNQEYMALTQSFETCSLSFSANSNLSQLTLIVPVFNTGLSYVSDLIASIKGQTYLPKETIFVNDASDDRYTFDLVSLLAEKMTEPYRLVHHEVNKGLSAARNTALNLVETPYLANVDSDDILTNSYVYDLVRAFERNPEVVAAVPYMQTFLEETPWNQSTFEGDCVYKPLGDGLIASMVDNQLGHANAGYRTENLKALGGWDQTDRSMWEDWSLYIKMVSQGMKVLVLPKTTCLYRVREQSMVRTYKTWPAMRKLAFNVEGITRFDAFRLMAVMRHYNDLQIESVQVLPPSQEVCYRKSAIFAMRVADKIGQFPLIFRPLHFTGVRIWRIMRSIKGLFK